MTNPALAKTTSNGRVYRDTLPPCDLLASLNYDHQPDAAYPSVTAVLSGGIPKSALVPWAAKAVAECALEYLEPDATTEKLWDYARRAACLQLAAAGKDEQPTDDDIRYHALKHLKGAPDRIRDRAAARGTSVHNIVEHLAAGDIVPTLGDDIEPWIASARMFVAEFRPQVIWSETTVFNRQFGYAGTLDLIADFPGYGRRIVDYKTSKAVYGDTGVQLAAYRYAEYGIHQGARQPLPAGVDGGLVVHLTDRGYKVIPVDCGTAQLDTFICAMDVANHCRNARKLIGAPLRPVDHTGDDLGLVKAWLTRRVRVIVQYPAAAQQLAQTWPAGVPTIGKPAHTPDELEQIEAALDRVEAAFELPFGEARPAPAGATTITPKRKRKQPEGKEQAA